jgi:hypothetical protein
MIVAIAVTPELARMIGNAGTREVRQWRDD